MYMVVFLELARLISEHVNTCALHLRKRQSKQYYKVIKYIKRNSISISRPRDPRPSGSYATVERTISQSLNCFDLFCLQRHFDISNLIMKNRRNISD